MRVLSSLTPAVVAALLGLSAATLVAAPAAAPPSVAHLRCEHQADPLGIDVAQPRLGWQLRSKERGVVQSAYQVEVTRAGQRVWDTGKVVSDRSVLVPYGGPAARVFAALHLARARLGRCGPAFGLERARLLGDGSALARRLEGPLDPGRPATRTRQGVASPRPCCAGPSPSKGAVRSARAYVTSLGLYELEINGRRVGDQLLTPGWTSYDHRLQYQTYDVTAHLRAGENAIGATLGDGWYRGLPRLEGPAQRLRRPPGAACASCGSSTPTAASRWSAPTGPGSRRRARSGRRTSTWARPTTRGSSGRAGARPGYDDSGLGGRAVAEPRREPSSRRPGRRCGGSRRSGRSRS